MVGEGRGVWCEARRIQRMEDNIEIIYNQIEVNIEGKEEGMNIE